MNSFDFPSFLVGLMFGAAAMILIQIFLSVVDE